ncbi:hypothetical protein Q5530_24145 [Saccharothrix sp. BKS2]|uniref:hypothetical protein n=1 Tax=Saccharothrix sp. BKS2 TaxID=3064400 RepID=UPI0039EC0726
MTIQQYRWTSRTGPDHLPAVDEIFPFGERRRLPVDVADIILINAMAPTASLKIKYATRENELRLLRSYLLDRADGAVHLLHDEFRSSSLHVRRFVSESFGLGMLSAAVQSAYEWVAGSDALYNFDALPVALARKYSKSRIRPDLLFRTPEFLLAGEARGRSSRPSASTVQQEERLNRLLPWAHARNQPLVMTWAYLTADGVTVHLYAPAEEGDWLDGEVGEPRPPSPPWHMDEAALTTLPGVVAPDALPAPVEGDAFPTPHGAEADTPRWSPPPRRPRSADLVSADALFSAGEDVLPLVAHQLFESAPETPTRVAGRSMRGRWIPIDPVDVGRGSLLLGVLDEPLSPQEGWALVRDLRARHRAGGPDADRFAGGDLAVAARGRFLVAVAPRRQGQPWDVLAD